MRADGKLKVLLFDVETSPNIAYIWGKYEQDAVGEFIKERKIISVAWKWLGDRKVQCLALPMLKTYKKDPDNNRALVRFLHRLIAKADIVVAHNVDAFDDPMANTDFIVNGLPPPPPHRTVDTLKFARHKFRFNSNKLGDLAQRLGLGKKINTGGFELWAGCLRGDPKSWSRMIAYNKRDVVVLERVYLRLRPWMTGHPNMSGPGKQSACPACESKRFISWGNWPTPWGVGKRFRCLDCGRWTKGKWMEKDKSWRFM